MLKAALGLCSQRRLPAVPGVSGHMILDRFNIQKQQPFLLAGPTSSTSPKVSKEGVATKEVLGTRPRGLPGPG